MVVGMEVVVQRVMVVEVKVEDEEGELILSFYPCRRR